MTPTTPLSLTTLTMRSRHDDGGVYLTVAGDHEVLFGYLASELVGRSAYEFFHPDDLVRISECHGATLDGDDDPQIVEYRLRCADGRYVDVRTTSRCVDGGTAIECATERLIRL